MARISRVGLLSIAAIILALQASCASLPSLPPIIEEDRDVIEAVWPKFTDGRVEATLGKPRPIHTDQERAALIEKAQQARRDLRDEVPPRSTNCVRVPLGSPIRIDGKLDDAAWQRAPGIAEFLLTRELTPESMLTRAKLMWDDNYLYMGFECEDADVNVIFPTRDADLWQADVVEVFIDANGDEMSYIELEVSPANVQYDATIADYRPEVNWAKDSGHLDIYRGIEIYDAPSLVSAAYVDGTLNDPTDTDRGWSCEIAISWEDIARGTNTNILPPKVGDVWRIGLYRININADKEKRPDEYAAWNPTTAWFHVPWVYGEVKFVK